MNELSLFFDEVEAIRVHNENVALLRKASLKFMKKGVLNSILIFGLSIILFLLMTALNYPMLIILVIALAVGSPLILLLYTFRYFLIRKKINKVSILSEDFIDKYNSIKEVKYCYDEDIIKYLEDGKEVYIQKWKDLRKIKRNINEIYLEFDDQNKDIWILKNMTVNEELNKFEKLIDTIKLKNNIAEG